MFFTSLEFFRNKIDVMGLLLTKKGYYSRHGVTALDWSIFGRVQRNCCLFVCLFVTAFLTQRTSAPDYEISQQGNAHFELIFSVSCNDGFLLFFPIQKRSVQKCCGFTYGNRLWRVSIANYVRVHFVLLENSTLLLSGGGDLLISSTHLLY